METGIFYFSATGNSLAAAKALKERFEDAMLINIASYFNDKAVCASFRRVIVVYPSYAYGMPLAVRRFFQRAEIKDSAYVAALVTYGSRQGGALAEAKRLLRRRGIRLDYGGRIPSVENFLPIFGAVKEKHLKKRTAMHRQAVRKAGNEIASETRRGVIAFRPFTKAVSVIFRAARPLLVKFYKVGESCGGCGICRQICPVQAIIMENNKPRFSKRCEICQACVNWCPQRAISVIRVKPETPRYAHEDVNISEFVLREYGITEIPGELYCKDTD